MNDIEIKQEITSLFSPENISMLKQFNELEARVKMFKSATNERIRELFEENNITSFENDDVKITYVPETTRTVVDTKKLKEEGIYDYYTTVTNVKSSVRITPRYEED